MADGQSTRRQGKAVARRNRMTPTGPGPRGATGHRAPKGDWSDRAAYRFDNALSRGPFVVIAYLALLSLLVVVVVSLVAALAGMRFGGSNGDSLAEDLWQSLLRVIDAGSFAADTAWPTRLLALATTLAGIFLAGSLIGLIANAVDQKVEDLRRGRSRVLEAGHTVLLGWSPQVPRIIGELVEANASQRRATVVVLARTDKAAMEDEIRDRVPQLRTTRVVCRSGNPALPDDLELAAVGSARSIVVVRDDDGDAGVVKAVLAVRALDPELSGAHVVAEVGDHDHARTLRAVTEGRVLTVSSDDVVAEVTAQACRQAGLAAVYQDLLDFDGDEVYFVPAGPVAGSAYRDVLGSAAACSVIGRLRADGVVELNPAPDTVVAADDEVIVVAEDDATAVLGPPRPVATDAMATPKASHAGEPDRIAIVGWSAFGSRVLAELDEFLAPGSTVDLVVDGDLVDAAEVEGLALEHARLSVRVGDGGPDDLAHLLEGPVPDQVIVLGYRDALGIDDADARTLLTLIRLRQAWPTGPGHVRIVAELLDQRHLVLADPVGVDDLIVSDALSSLLLAQLSERAELQAVFDELFEATGAVVELQPATGYVAGPGR